MSVALINLVAIHSLELFNHNHWRTVCSAILALSEHQPALHPVFAVPNEYTRRIKPSLRTASNIAIIPINTKAPPPPLACVLNADVVISPFSSGSPFEEMTCYEHIPHFVCLPPISGAHPRATQTIDSSRLHEHKQLHHVHIIPPITSAQAENAYGKLFIQLLPAVFGSEASQSVPMVPLSKALQTHYSNDYKHQPADQGSFAGVDTDRIDIAMHVAYLQQMLEHERTSTWGNLPLVGIVARALIRLYNMGPFWHTSNIISLALTRQQARLSATLDALRLVTNVRNDECGVR